jgi:transposase
MFLRASSRTKNGKTHTYWRLVESVRVNGKVAQRTIAHLGAVDAEGRGRASALARRLLGDHFARHDPCEDRSEFDAQKVKLGDVRVENARSFGGVWLALQLWRALKLDVFFGSSLPGGREHVPWVDVSMILVFARLCEPSSELHIAETWYRHTALRDILGVADQAVHHTRLYAGLDQILPLKDALEMHLRARFGELFALDYELLLYDVTSTYFEGKAEGVGMAAHGYSRDHRPDCKQVCLALVVTKDGFPLGYQLFPGNRVDVTTVREIVEAMEKKHGRSSRVWVMDRGMVSEKNLAWLRESDRKYVVATPRVEVRKFETQLANRAGWTTVREGLDVQLVSHPEGGEETFILCRSADRREKDAGIRRRFRRRLLRDLGRLALRLHRAKRKLEVGPIERQIGKTLARNSRGASTIDVFVEEDARRASGVRLVIRAKRPRKTLADLTDGAYLLRSNVSHWSPEDLWNVYVQLCDVEDAFRTQKSELMIRPIWHQRQERVEAHIFVSFLAYAMWKTLEGWMTRAGLGNAPRKVLDELARIQAVDVVIPTVNGPVVRLRCVTRPDQAQRAIIDRLGIRLPRRLRVPETELV